MCQSSYICGIILKTNSKEVAWWMFTESPWDNMIESMTRADNPSGTGNSCYQMSKHKKSESSSVLTHNEEKSIKIHPGTDIIKTTVRKMTCVRQNDDGQMQRKDSVAEIPENKNLNKNSGGTDDYGRLCL